MVLRALVMVCGALAALVLAASFALDSRTLDTGALGRLPACPAKLAGSSCALCGMTHGMVAISEGRFAEGARWNRGAPWLYAALVAMALAAAALGLAGRTKQKRQQRAGGGAGRDDPLLRAQKVDQQPDQRAHGGAYHGEQDSLCHTVNRVSL